MKLKFKLLIDIFMLLGFVFLLDTEITGIFLHEVLGLMILAIFIIHKYLNIKWITSITRKLFKNPNFLNSKLFVMYISNVILFLLAFSVIISGILISQYLFTNLSISTPLPLAKLHNNASYVLLVFVSLHIFLHFKILKSYKTFFLIFIILLLAGAITIYHI